MINYVLNEYSTEDSQSKPPKTTPFLPVADLIHDCDLDRLRADPFLAGSEPWVDRGEEEWRWDAGDAAQTV